MIVLSPPTQAITDARYRGYPVILIRVGNVLTDADLDILGRDALRKFSVPDFTHLFNVNFDTDICNSG